MKYCFSYEFTILRCVTSKICSFNQYSYTAFADPKIEGVTIYLADFERPITEKLKKDFFQDPTSTSLTCARGTTIKVGDISKDPEGEEVFEAKRGLFFKVLHTHTTSAN